MAALCCGLAASVTVAALRPAPPPSAPVVVAARDVPAGTALSAADLRSDEVPTRLLPDTVVVDPDAVVGRRTTVALRAGTLLQESLVAGGELAAGAPDGTVVAPVRLDPGVAGLLGAGDRVDLLAVPDWPAVEPLPHDAAVDGTVPADDPYLARGAVVVPAPDADDGGGLLGSGSSGADAVTLVAVRPEEAVRLASVAGHATVTAVLVP